MVLYRLIRVVLSEKVTFTKALEEYNRVTLENYINLLGLHSKIS